MAIDPLVKQYKIQMYNDIINARKATGAQTPDAMVKIDEELKSTTEGFEAYAELFSFELDMSRDTDASVAGNLKSSSAVRGQTAVILISRAASEAVLYQKFLKGEVIKELEIVDLGNFANVNVKESSKTFSNCHINSISVVLAQYLEITFRYEQVKMTNTEYDQTGSAAGNAEATYNFTTGKVE